MTLDTAVLTAVQGPIPHPMMIITMVFAAFLAYWTAYSVYSVFFHPLHTYPGPKLSAITRLPYWIACLQGSQVRHMMKLHKKYGPVVRFGPNDLSYSEPQAWREIYTVPSGRKENGKEVKFHAPSANGVPNIITQNDVTRHAQIRRVFLPAFSERSLRSKEPLFQKYANMMVAKGRDAKTINMAKLYNHTAFDIMAELAFGEPLGVLEHGNFMPWLAAVFPPLRVLPFVQMIEFYPLAKKIFDLIEPQWVAAMRRDHYNHTAARVDKRYQEVSQKTDIWNLVIESDLSYKESLINAELFMSAGTETTASLLTGLTYYLVSNPDKKQKLTEIIRGRFKEDQDITMETLADIEYLNACLREALRMYPPVPSAIPREIADGGNIIMGKWLPAGTRVSVHNTAANRSPDNFRNPDKFAPERWLGDAEYVNDRKDAAQPFSIGPRNCLGMNMAWHEMRLLISKLLFHFDIDSDVGPDWADQNVYVIWERKPLVCHLSPVKVSE